MEGTESRDQAAPGPALEGSSQTPCGCPSTPGPLRVLQAGWESREGEAFPRFAVPGENSTWPRGSSAEPSVPRAANPAQGNPTAFQNSYKFCTTLSSNTTGERSFPPFPSAQGIGGIKNRGEGSALQNCPRLRERGEFLSPHQHQIQKYTFHGNTPVLQSEHTREPREFCTNPAGSWDTPQPFLDEVREVQVSEATGEEPNFHFYVPKLSPKYTWKPPGASHHGGEQPGSELSF